MTRIQTGKQILIDALGLSYNEFHALVLGASVGVLTGVLFAIGHTSLAVLLTLCMVLFAILGKPFGRADKHASNTIGAKTIKYEPWYFASATLSKFVLAIAISFAV